MSDNDKMREAVTAATKIVTNPHGYTETSVLVAKAFLEQASQAEQSVPVVGEPVGFILLHENGGKNLTFHDNTGKLSDGWSQHKLVIHPATSITAAELERLRKDEELKASEASIGCEALQEIIDLLPGSSVAQAKLIAVAAMTKRAAIAAGEGMK